MTFEEILDQAIAMLQRRGRVTYGALKLQFHLDDDQLAVLKDELLYAQQVARDEDGRVLVWTDGATAPPAPGPTVSQLPPVPQDAAPRAVASGVIAPQAPEAERRRPGRAARRRATVRADVVGDPRAASRPPTRHARSWLLRRPRSIRVPAPRTRRHEGAVAASAQKACSGYI